MKMNNGKKLIAYIKRLALFLLSPRPTQISCFPLPTLPSPSLVAGRSVGRRRPHPQPPPPPPLHNPSLSPALAYKKHQSLRSDCVRIALFLTPRWFSFCLLSRCWVLLWLVFGKVFIFADFEFSEYMTVMPWIVCPEVWQLINMPCFFICFFCQVCKLRWFLEWLCVCGIAEFGSFFFWFCLETVSCLTWCCNLSLEGRNWFFFPFCRSQRKPLQVLVWSFTKAISFSRVLRCVASLCLALTISSLVTPWHVFVHRLNKVQPNCRASDTARKGDLLLVSVPSFWYLNL